MARILLHLRTPPGSPSVKQPVDPGDIYVLEAENNDTWVRFRSQERILDVRRIRELMERLEEKGFYRIHHSYAVNLNRVEVIRQREGSHDWEVVMEPPVNAVLPVARGRLKEFWARYV